MDTIHQQVLSQSQLISLPEVYLKLQELINSDDFSMTEVADVISLDPAISARLLRMVNSSFFGLATQIDTLGHAINYLGVQQVHDLVLSTSIAQSFSEMNNEEFNLHKYWQQCVFSAIAARELAVLCNVLNSERLFVSGLLRDVGHLMMYQSIPELMTQASNKSEQEHIPLHLAEQQLFNFDYAQIGAELLENWNLPESLTLAIRFQLDPNQVTLYRLETAILHIAAILTETYAKDETAHEKVFNQIDPQVIELTQILPQQFEHTDILVRENLHKVMNLLFPQYKIAV